MTSVWKKEAPTVSNLIILIIILTPKKTYYFVKELFNDDRKLE